MWLDALRFSCQSFVGSNSVAVCTDNFTFGDFFFDCCPNKAIVNHSRDIVLFFFDMVKI